MTRFSSVTAVLILAAITYASAGDDWAKELLKKENDNRAKHGSGKLQQSDEVGPKFNADCLSLTLIINMQKLNFDNLPACQKSSEVG